MGLLATGCALSGLGSGQPARGQSQSPATQGGQPTGGTATGPALQAQPSRTKKLQIEGTKNATVTVGLVSFRVQGKLAKLTLLFTPKMPKAPQDKEISIYDMFNSHGPYVTLVDPVHLKRYVVVRDSEKGKLQSDTVWTGTVNGQPVAAYYTFAAPPPKSKLNLHLNGRLVFSDIPVSR